MANEFMRRSFEKGYDKFTEIGYNFWTLVNGASMDLPFDTIVYFLMHTDSDDNGNEKAKTIGKLLDEKITLEGMTSIVLKTAVKDGVYTFTTQNNGHDTVKSPLGMFSTYEIDNDLKAVDTAIRKYWELGTPIEDSAEIMAEHDAVVESGGVSTDAPKPEKRTRRRRTEEPPAEAPSNPTESENEEAEETAPTRERRRRRATEAATAEEPKPRRRRATEAATEEEPKPRRRRATEAATEEEPKPRRRRTRE